MHHQLCCRLKGKEANPCFIQLCTSKPTTTPQQDRGTVQFYPMHAIIKQWCGYCLYTLTSETTRSHQTQLTSSPPLYVFLMLLRSMAVWQLVDVLQQYDASAIKRDPSGLLSCGAMSCSQGVLSMRLMASPL